MLQFLVRKSRIGLLWILALVAVYINISYMAYNLRNPEMTMMQCFLDFWAAMRWQ